MISIDHGLVGNLCSFLEINTIYLSLVTIIVQHLNLLFLCLKFYKSRAKIPNRLIYIAFFQTCRFRRETFVYDYGCLLEVRTLKTKSEGPKPRHKDDETDQANGDDSAQNGTKGDNSVENGSKGDNSVENGSKGDNRSQTVTKGGNPDEDYFPNTTFTDTMLKDYEDPYAGIDDGKY